MKTYFDIQGDGGSHVVEQLTELNQTIAGALSGVRHRLAIGSGKGGVGKSTFTMALARALTQKGQRVAILDADFNGPCQAHLAGLDGSPWIPSADGSGLAMPRRADGIGVVSMGSVLSQAQPMAFETVSRGSAHTWRATREFATLAQLMSSIEWGTLDVLLFDLPPGADRTQHYAEFLGDETPFVLVTIPSDVSHGVVARSVSTLGQTSARLLGYVENMAGYYCAGCGEVRPLFPSSPQSLDAPLLGRIPFDPALAELCDRGWPETDSQSPQSQESERAGSLPAIAEVASRILDSLETPS